ncbi:DUF4150 domain-containing protein [Bordetella parapertussis]|uniref:DUF4150 domain-containing protein n=1 Tax=Bordetella parapertussis TaxID=519 RepID=UPI000B273143|nr:DUF4150 domain-containing protein [Bordetella parapertussis]
MFADCQLMGMDLAFPDICKTPPALLPIPYPNFALGPMGIPNVWNVLLMAMPAHNLLTTIALSNGDNPGIGMGLISQTVMAQARRITCVPNVLFGCIPATRLTGVTVQNTINTVGMRVVPSQLKVVLLGGGGGGGAAKAAKSAKAGKGRARAPAPPRGAAPAARAARQARAGRAAARRPARASPAAARAPSPASRATIRATAAASSARGCATRPGTRRPGAARMAWCATRSRARR